MNAAAVRVLYHYITWAYQQIWDQVKQLPDDLFIKDTGYSVGSLRNHLVHLASVDTRWFARARGVTIPDPLVPEDFPTIADVERMWDVVYRDLNPMIDNLTDAKLHEEITYTSRGDTYTHPNWRILLHVLNHGTDHRAQMLYALHRLGMNTFEQDFVYYLRDEIPPREGVKIDREMLLSLFRYDTYATGRLVSECLAGLSDADLDRNFNYSHNTIRAQLAHIMVAGQYWLGRAFERELPADLSAGSRLLADITDRALLDPIEYTTGGGVRAANTRWEMLWHLVNHGTDHRAQTLALLHDLGAPTFEQDMMIYFWDL
jgi:uncharacterized damage-inducible protein DinB